MRLAAAILAASLLAACGGASAPATPMGATAQTEVTILASDGAVMRPIANGGRVALRDGSATIHFSSLAFDRVDLDVALFDAAGHAATGEVTVSYQSLDMDHGMLTAKGVQHEAGYRVPIEFVMPGRWRLVLHVTRGGAEETVTLVLPEVGM